MTGTAIPCDPVDCAQLAAPLWDRAFQARVRRVEHICNWLLERSLQLPEARRLLKRYCKYRNCLFVFLYRTDVNPTNNLGEQSLRPSVVHRKIIGCFRSGWGAQAYAAIASVIGTAALKNLSLFEAMQNLWGACSPSSLWSVSRY
jgi:hypothetical protein